ncbi:MAG: hypothetical protein WA154_06355 [Moraxellaceae bacterium]
MATLKDMLNALGAQPELSSAQEVKSACELIIEVQDMSNGKRDCIMAAFEQGPLFDGDVPSKSCRDELIQDGYMAKVVVKGDEGQNACTEKGACAYRLMEIGV